MIIKIIAIQKQDEAGNVIMDEGNKIAYDKERAMVISKDGRYQRIVSLTDEMAAKIAEGNRYFNAVEKNGTLHITGPVAARF